MHENGSSQSEHRTEPLIFFVLSSFRDSTQIKSGSGLFPPRPLGLPCPRERAGDFAFSDPCSAVFHRQSSNFSSRSAATPHKLRSGTRRSTRCTTSNPRRRRGFLEGAINRKEQYPPGCNRRASERMTTAKETYFTSVVCVKSEYDPSTHESFYVKYKVPSDFQCKVWTSLDSHAEKKP